MKIEIEGDIQHIQVIESVVREFVPTIDFDRPIGSVPHFQSRFLIDEEAKAHFYEYELSYYDSGGTFLGATECEARKKRSITGEPRLISEMIEFPKETAVVKLRFIQVEDYMKSTSNTLYLTVFAIGLLVGLLISWVM